MIKSSEGLNLYISAKTDFDFFIKFKNAVLLRNDISEEYLKIILQMTKIIDESIYNNNDFVNLSTSINEQTFIVFKKIAKIELEKSLTGPLENTYFLTNYFFRYLSCNEIVKKYFFIDLNIDISDIIKSKPLNTLFYNIIMGNIYRKKITIHTIDSDRYESYLLNSNDITHLKSCFGYHQIGVDTHIGILQQTIE